MKRKLLFIVTGILFFNHLKAQPEAESSQIKIVEQSPSAPNTASLGKYFDIPVNMSTGVPSIQIPLYVIKTGGITIPITLSYHSAGNKVNNPASWVGFGWDLSCGGAVTKQVNGLDDFYATTQYPEPTGGTAVPAWSDYMNPDYTIDANLGFTTISSVIDSIMSGYGNIPGNLDQLHRLLGRIIQNKYDGESDEYSFRTTEGSGSIYYNQKNTAFETNELAGWKVSYDSYNDAWHLQQKDGKGFYFSAKEEALSPYFESPVYPYPNKFFTSTWYLTGIDDPINGRGVSLEYDYAPFWYLSNVVANTENWSMTSNPPSYAGGSTRNVMRYGNQLNLKRIVFEEGSIEFIKDQTARLDGGVNALKTIKIFDKNNVLKKQFEFIYFYAWSGTANAARLFLKSVQEINYISGSVNENRPYVIHYDTTAAMPPRFSFAQDIWGYNNGKTSNSTTIPTITELTLMGIPAHADRDVDTNYTKSGIIKQIVYPTGGSLNFSFENNRDDANNLVGGLRIKRILNYDSVASKSITTEYRYNDDNGNSTGMVANRPVFHYFFQEGDYGEAYCRISGDPVYPLFGNQGSPVAYTRVEKVEIGDNQEFKSRHFFYDGLSGLNISPEATYRNYSEGVPYNKHPDLQRFSYHPYSTEVFKKLPNGLYKLIKKDVQAYDVLNQFKKYIWNVQAAWGQTNWGVFTEWAGFDPYSRNPINPVPYLNAYKIIQDNIINTATSSETYDDNNNIIGQTVTKVFDTLNGNLKKVTTVASNGDTLRTYFTYSSDFLHTSSSDPVNQQINLLLDNNIMAAPVEVIKTQKIPGTAEIITDADLFFYESNKLKKNLKITEDIPFSGFAAAYNNSTGFYYDSRYQLESEIELFDANKNPTQIKLKDKTQSLIWDKDNIQAAVINAGAANIAATSFETTEKGNWNYSGTAVVDNTVPTGLKGYNLSTGNITSNAIDASKQYIVSYWSKNGAQTVNGVSATTGRTVSGWTYYEHLIPASGGQITVSGSGTIDELRLYPKGSLMTTYTYIPLIGMQNQCDANNRISYYEYDGLGRLVIIRDQDKNVLKKVCYNYAGQPENCTFNCLSTAPNWQNTSTPLRCQQNANGNTGYQEQEQKDMNPCSPSFNQTQWIQAGYNGTACPPSTNVAITYQNNTSVTGFTAVYTNTTTGQTYSYAIPVGSGTLASIPPATYSISISKPGNNIWLLFGCGCRTASGTSAYFTKVIVSSSNCNVITIDYDL